MKKKDKSINFIAGGIINQLSRGEKEQTLGDQLCDGLQGNQSCDTILHVQLVPNTLHLLPKINGGYFLNSHRVYTHIFQKHIWLFLYK
jgi:hypothetical protein